MRKRLNTRNPLNRNWGPNQGLTMRLLTLPNNSGGRQWFDIAGNNHGTLTNGPTWSSMRRDNSFGCVSFDGVNDYVACGNSGAIASLTGNVPISLSLWCKPASSGSLQIIAGKAVNAINSQEFWIEYGRGGAATFSVIWGGAIVATSATHTAGSWYHVGFSRGGSSGAWAGGLYVNGNREATIATATNPAGNGTFAVGKGGDIGFNFSGSVDDVCLGPLALSTSEVYAHFDDSLRGYHKSLNWRRSVWAVPASSGGGFLPHWARRQPQTIGGGIL